MTTLFFISWQKAIVNADTRPFSTLLHRRSRSACHFEQGVHVIGGEGVRILELARKDPKQAVYVLVCVTHHEKVYLQGINGRIVSGDVNSAVDNHRISNIHLHCFHYACFHKQRTEAKNRAVLVILRAVVHLQLQVARNFAPRLFNQLEVG